MNNPEGGGWSEMGPHDKFLELCAVSTSGDLTEEEQRNLQAHLAECPDCRQALKEFEAAADVGIPVLHSELSTAESVEPSAILLEGGKTMRTGAVAHIETTQTDREPVGQGSELRFPHRNGHRQIQVNWHYVWMPFAAAAGCRSRGLPKAPRTLLLYAGRFAAVGCEARAGTQLLATQ